MNVITPLVQFQQQMRIFHWQTDSFAQHKAFGKIYESLDELVDDFVETFMGTFGKSKPTTTFTLNLLPLEDENTVSNVLEDFIDYLKEMSFEIEDHTDLLNIRDSMLGEVNKLKYLLTLS
jgi:DNA-binding ferritin-like protein